MIIYKILLCLVVFGAVSGVIHESGFYPVSLPESGTIGITQAEVTDMTSGVTNSPLNMFTTLSVLGMLLSVLLNSLLTMLTIIPLLTSYGIPLNIATMIQIPVWTITAWGLYELWTGNQTPGME